MTALQRIRHVSPQEYERIRSRLDGRRFGEKEWRREMPLHKTAQGRIKQTFGTGFNGFCVVTSFLKDSMATAPGQSEPPRSYQEGTWEMRVIFRRENHPRLKVLLDAFEKKAHDIGTRYSPGNGSVYHAMFGLPAEGTPEDTIEQMMGRAEEFGTSIQRVIDTHFVQVACDNMELGETISSAYQNMSEENSLREKWMEDNRELLAKCKREYGEGVAKLAALQYVQESMAMVADKD